MNLRELVKEVGGEERFVSGHRACPGCCEHIIIRQILLACRNYDIVVSCATGCLEVTTSIFPYTSWKIPFIHSAFENSAATIAGVETAYKALLKRNKININNVKFIGIAGDGGTYDIGLQALSGAVERGHDIVFVCLDNQAYMNTGIQRSSSTPQFAHTTTSPAGEKIPGKMNFKKDITSCIAAHSHKVYVAQASPAYFNDLMYKAKKAVEFNGPAFLNILAPCRLGWGFNGKEGIEMAREAVKVCFWPLYEIEDGVLKINYKPKEKNKIYEFLKKQARFSHIFKNKDKDRILNSIQEDVDRKWEILLDLENKTIF